MDQFQENLKTWEQINSHVRMVQQDLSKVDFPDRSTPEQHHAWAVALEDLVSMTEMFIGQALLDTRLPDPTEYGRMVEQEAR